LKPAFYLLFEASIVLAARINKKQKAKEDEEWS